MSRQQRCLPGCSARKRWAWCPHSSRASRIGQRTCSRPSRELAGTLSSLARLDAARATSPVPPGSPWWAAEAAELAERAGLPVRARAEARRALAKLLAQLDSIDISALPGKAARAAWPSPRSPRRTSQRPPRGCGKQSAGDPGRGPPSRHRYPNSTWPPRSRDSRRT